MFNKSIWIRELTSNSQGGQLVHNAADQLSSDNSAKVGAGTSTFHASAFCIMLTYTVSVIIFGDPNDGDAIGSIPAENVKVICHDGDNICDGGILVLAPHLNVIFLLSVT